MDYLLFKRKFKKNVTFNYTIFNYSGNNALNSGNSESGMAC